MVNVNANVSAGGPNCGSYAAPVPVAWPALTLIDVDALNAVPVPDACPALAFVSDAVEIVG
jgi:hypothetical protein